MTTPIRNVSDTARWVAAYRAIESRRKDALFHDPFAEKLAGERGMHMARLANVHSQWSLITRTRLIDDLVMQAVARGTDCVLNLAAGFDTRPYRLPLPSELLWIEADLAPLIDEKERLLQGETARCRLERERVDLASTDARGALLRDVNGRAHQTLVITEGLVIYLDADTVSELCRDLVEQANLRHWIVDFSAPELVQMMRKSLGGTLANAPFEFAPPDGVSFFEHRGWKAQRILSLLREAGKLHRLPFWMRLFAMLPQPNPRQSRGRWSVIVQFERESER